VTDHVADIVGDQRDLADREAVQHARQLLRLRLFRVAVSGMGRQTHAAQVRRHHGVIPHQPHRQRLPHVAGIAEAVQHQDRGALAADAHVDRRIRGLDVGNREARGKRLDSRDRHSRHACAGREHHPTHCDLPVRRFHACSTRSSKPGSTASRLARKLRAFLAETAAFFMISARTVPKPRTARRPLPRFREWLTIAEASFHARRHQARRIFVNPEGAYGTSLADAFRLDHAPAITTRALRKSRLAVTEVRCDHEHFGMTSPIAREDAWLIALQMRPCEKHELWSDNRPAAVTPIVGGETMIYDLRRDPVAHIDSAFHSLHFYVPKSALDWIADDFGAPRIDELDCTVGRRIDDPVVRSLAGAMLPALSHPEAVNAAFAEHVLIAIAAHVAGTYGHMRLARRVVRGGLAAWQERRAKEMLTANLAADVSLSDLALECGLSVSH